MWEKKKGKESSKSIINDVLKKWHLILYFWYNYYNMKCLDKCSLHYRQFMHNLRQTIYLLFLLTHLTALGLQTWSDVGLQCAVLPLYGSNPDLEASSVGLAPVGR